VAFEHQAEARRKQDVAVLGAFAAIDKNLAGIEVDIADLDDQRDGLRRLPRYVRPEHW
jgi:hypothetical protein